MLLPSTCLRASSKTDAFACNHSTLIQILVEEKNLMPVTTLDPRTAPIASVFPCLGETGSTHDILNLLATRSA